VYAVPIFKQRNTRSTASWHAPLITLYSTPGAVSYSLVLPRSPSAFFRRWIAHSFLGIGCESPVAPMSVERATNPLAGRLAAPSTEHPDVEPELARRPLCCLLGSRLWRHWCCQTGVAAAPRWGAAV